MAALLNAAYSVLVVLVAVGGIAFVFYSTGRDAGDGESPEWSQWALGLVVAAFLAMMVGGLVT